MTSDQLTQDPLKSHLPFSRETGVFSVVVFAMVTLSIVFSVEIPIGLGVSEYASINSEDFGVTVLSLWLAKKLLLDKERIIGPLLPAVMALLLIATGWIVLTFGIATVRSTQSVAPSALWIMKWFEVLVFFICVQHLLKQRSATVVVKTIVAGGTLLSVYSIYASQLLAVRRVRVFFGNPNTLSAFFVLIVTISLSGVIANHGRDRVAYVMTGLLAGGATLTTLSRSGIIALIVSLSTLVVLHHRNLTRRVLAGLTAGAVSLGLIMSYVLQDRLSRFFNWIQITPEGISLASGTAGRSFRVRLELLQKSWDLWVEQPIFGYGWFASPSRVGFLDNLYAILLVELGLPGLIIMLGLYVVVLRTLFQLGQAGSSYLSNAVFAWFMGMLAMSIAGGFPRAPQMMMLWLLLLTATWVLGEDGIWTTNT
ncbi:O-antigen ligase family protein [Halorubrum ezzemoulense]|uniref:O-antigen ligase family protein n=1 Tax=Halorubrum ezzemoulense TaxID=337243 RepID=A0ABT4Z7I4_HALEZ|nr:O-antigen ligase family protein [Halorubrum ezzemoulense]MDB2294118.1 O-antigen ligase family protein [Halorubrum ezzemoulense]